QQRRAGQEGVARGRLVSLDVADADVAAERHSADLGMPGGLDEAPGVLLADRSVVAERGLRAEVERAAERGRVIEVEQAVCDVEVRHQPVHGRTGRRTEALGLER